MTLNETKITSFNLLRNFNDGRGFYFVYWDLFLMMAKFKYCHYDEVPTNTQQFKSPHEIECACTRIRS